jgi:hypothetical protein
MVQTGKRTAYLHTTGHPPFGKAGARGFKAKDNYKNLSCKRVASAGGMPIIILICQSVNVLKILTQKACQVFKK